MQQTPGTQARASVPQPESEYARVTVVSLSITGTLVTRRVPRRVLSLRLVVTVAESGRDPEFSCPGTRRRTRSNSTGVPKAGKVITKPCLQVRFGSS
eukprot:2692673-Rhodomonas_salina.1